MKKIDDGARGFTLIELLVVISIISLMSSVVLASLTTARTKAADTAIKANLRNIKSAAELYLSNNGSYGDPLVSNTGGAGDGTPCPTSGNYMFADSRIAAGIAQSWQLGDPTFNTSVCAIGPNGQTWAIQTRLKSSNSPWCIDSAGFVGLANITGGGSSNAICDDGS